MAFSETLKLKVKKRAHFQCCLCHALGVEVHHIVPESESGPDTDENAAPLCPSCHETYGANPDKRKFIREARDFWYELCLNRFPSDAHQLQTISDALRKVATKEDLERISVQNSAFVLGQPPESRRLSWEHLHYSFIREEYIHPLIVRELLGWISDPGEPVVAVDLSQANRSNRFFGEFSVHEHGPRPLLEWKGTEGEFFTYSLIATSPSGVHMGECYDCGGGSGIFGRVSFLAFDSARSLDVNDSGNLFTRERILLKALGSIGLGDRYAGEIKYSNGLLIIGPDEGWFRRGEEACQEMPVR